MKRLLERSLLGLTLCTFLCAGCSGGNKKQVAENPDVNEMKTDDGLKTLQVGDVNVTWIQDNAEDKLMPVSLFPDASQELIESLSLQAGIPFGQCLPGRDRQPPDSFRYRTGSAGRAVAGTPETSGHCSGGYPLSLPYPFPWRPYRGHDAGRQCRFPQRAGLRFEERI